MIKTKIVSSLEKVLLEDSFDSYKPLEYISALRGERISFQIIHTFEYSRADMDLWAMDHSYTKIEPEGELKDYISIRDVCNVGVERPTLARSLTDEDYISKRPGLFPDVLRPLHMEGRISPSPYLLNTVWVEINIPENFKPGKQKLTFAFTDADGETTSLSLEIEIIDAVLPKDEIYYTQWFHTDSLANYYNVPVWSERHWEIIENFARVAVKNGINMLLTPVFTPPLDTEIGGERLTTQLVGVTKVGKDYSFDFALLDRWIDMCNRVGIKYFEINHFFTQWGAKHAPKVMATVDGEYKRIFGWETDAAAGEYGIFLRAFLSEFLIHMKKRGDDKRCFFHISDEPHIQHTESYKAAREIISDLLDGYVIMDAISDYDFFKLGILDTPIPANNHIEKFLENKVPGLWTYYCCAQLIGVSNRLIAMTSYRNRSIGFQMYKYDIVGFLQWGFNFYNNRHSHDSINPYLQQDGDNWVPAGDAFSVYPERDGTALESLRLVVFHEALQDMKAMKLCESFYGKDAVVKVIDDAMGLDVNFETCAKSADTILSMREKINTMIKNAVK